MRHSGTPIVMILCSLVLLVFGYLIRYKKQVNLIAGYDADQVSDPDGLANWVGGWSIALGVATIPQAFLFYFFRGYALSLVTAMAVVTLAVCAVMVFGARRFKRR